MKLRIALVVALLGSFTVAQAKAPSKKLEAQKHYDAGTAHYKAQEYDQAVEEWEAGYQLKPDPTYLYNLGQASRLAHHPDKALDYYQQFLAAVPDTPNKAVVEQRIAEVQKEIAAQKKQAEAPPPPPPPAEPAPAPAAKPVAPIADGSQKPWALDLPSTPYQLGARIRGIFVTPAMMAPFLYAATGMESVSVGVEFIYRKPTYDVVTSLDFSWLDVHDGNYLAVNHEPTTDTQYTQFRNLSFISVDVSLIGHYDITKWLELRYGGGLGIGAVLGDVLLTHDSGPDCSLQHAASFASCHPNNVDPNMPLEPQLKATEPIPPGGKDTSVTPHRHVTSDKPPVMGVVNLLVGLRLKLPKKWTAQVEIGFRDAIFVGAGVHYLF
jgi:hypothetical protein